MGHLRDNTHSSRGGTSVLAPCCHESCSALSRPSNTNLVPTIVYGVTCAASRFAIYDRGGASEPAVETSEHSLACYTHTLASTSTELVFRGCVVVSGGTTLQGMGERVANEPTTWRPSHLCAVVVFTGGTAMIQGINEHVANDLTELFPST